jgi:DNA processing protein
MAETLYTDDLVDSVRLALVSGVGPRHRQDLLAMFGSSATVLAASKSGLQEVSGIGPKIAARIAAARDEIDVEAELELAAANDIDVLVESDPRYPPILRQIHDPPGVLFRRGTSSPQDEMAIAIVGTRHATRYGLAQAERLAGSLARRQRLSSE